MNLVNFPNCLTLIRIALIPILVLFYYLPWQYSSFFCAFIFVFAAITDWLDGFIARKYKLETKFGAFCDPVADKLIVVIALLLIVEAYNSFILTLPAVVIVSREVLIAGLREWMAHQGKSNLVAVTYASKVKTFLQMLAISLLLYSCNNLYGYVGLIGIGTLFIAALITLWTMCVYIVSAWPDIFGK